MCWAYNPPLMKRHTGKQPKSRQWRNKAIVSRRQNPDGSEIDRQPLFLPIAIAHRFGPIAPTQFRWQNRLSLHPARLGFGLPARPRAAELTALAEGWRPWCGVAARLLWAYYAASKRREGI